MDSKKYLSEKTINRITELIEDEYMLDLIKETSEFLDNIISGDDIPEQSTEVFPGAINIEFEPMKMIATLEILKPINSENEITIKKVKEVIAENGEYFESRVDWNIVHDIFERVIIKDEIVSPLIIAKGSTVQARIPEHIMLEKDLYSNYKPLISSRGDADYHHIHSLVFVNKDQYLGEIINEQVGKNGKKLDGKELPYPTIIENNYVADENIYTKNGKIFASISGSFKIIENKIAVSKCLYIKTDLDYHTGDINFDGDVEVEGSIRSGFEVISGGDIHIKGALEPANLICNNNAIISLGIFGSKENRVEVKGKLITKHIENATVRSTGDIMVENSIVNSIIYSNSFITMGEKGTIVGRQIFSLNGVKCNNIGNYTGIHTEINLGVDYVTMEKLQKTQKLAETLTNEMETLQHEINLMETREEKDKGKYLFLSLKNKLSILNYNSKELLKNLDKNDKSTLEVSGTVFPGTKITICHISKVITEPLNNVRFFLNKDHGRVEWTSPI